MTNKGRSRFPLGMTNKALVGGVGQGVHVGYVEGCALDGDVGIVDLGAVGGSEGVTWPP